MAGVFVLAQDDALGYHRNMAALPPPRSDRTAPPRPFSGLQILFASILAIGLLLAIDFSSRIAQGQLAQQSRASLEMEIATLEAAHAALIQERDYVQSDAYVEAWAHAEGKMVRSGEVLVIPVPVGPTGPTPTPTPEAPAILLEEQEEVETWRLWWALFFDDSPPF